MKWAARLASKYLPVPDSLSGERADAALAKMLGISRSQAADLLGEGAVTRAGKTLGKSDRLELDQIIEVELIERSTEPEVIAEDVAELKVVFQDEHMIVIDKPAGVVSHPSLGFEGPSVPGVLLARGIQLATSGAQERQGIFDFGFLIFDCRSHAGSGRDGA
jgi:23S rRNA pseudouridine1911/1915/1917 synthase